VSVTRLVHLTLGAFAVAAMGSLVAARASVAPSTALAQFAFAREDWADVGSARIFYRDSGGTGVPVVLLHAATGSSAVWEHQLPSFIAAGFRVVAYDRRGYGRTEIKDPAAPSSTAADDLTGLLTHLGVDRVHLVGTAAGGIVAVDFALSFPERLRSLVVANSIVGVQDEDYLALSGRLRPTPQFDALPAEFRELGPSYRASNDEGTRQWISLEQRSRASGTRVAPQATRNRITFKMLESLKVPALMLTGDADLYSPPPVLRLIAARIPGSETVIVDDAGHSAYWEQPDVFNTTVLDFIRRH
jgi:pimeloyl-ACP methyl ester carboxylesterase